MKIHFGHLLATAALAVAGCAAFFSVFGLSQLFAGASIAVIIMASALEFSKVVSASFLHKYWNDMAKTLKIYLTIGVIVLVTITSAGIYGFLSSAYQKTASNLEVHNGQVGILESKSTQFQAKIDANKQLIDSRTKRIDQLNNLRAGQENRLGDKRSANATRKDITSSNIEIKELNLNIDGLNAENNKLLDSVSFYKMKKLETTSNSKVAGEVGPLKYLSDLTGKPMDKIVNYFILLLVFVFDPLAISLVIATTWVFEKKRKETLIKPIEKDLIFDKSDDDLEIVSNEIKENTEQELNISNNTVEEVNDDQLEIDFNIQPELIEEPLIEVEEEEHIDDSVHFDEIPVYVPVIPTGKVERKDIKEVKERERGFSIKIPESKSSIQRIGGQKIIKDNNKNNIIFKRNGI